MADSKYCYPGTDVLINIPGIKEQEELSRYERIVTASRITELGANPIYGNFDLKHMQQIHKYIFQDVYPFAGKIRDVDITKQDTLFCKAPYIQDNAKDIYRGLKDEMFLKGLDADRFADRAAHYMAEVNMLHPFREGNGRVQREFVRGLSLNSGYKLDWNRVDKDSVLDASIKSVHNTKDLANVVRSSIVNELPDRDLMDFFKDLQPGMER